MSVISSAHIIYVVLQLLAVFATVAHGSHFRGGLVRVRTVGPISRTTLTVDITQRYGWRRSYGHNTYCDDSTITSRRVIADVGSLICRIGCAGGSLSVGIFCTDYSVAGDWTVGERTQRIALPFAPVLEASFASRAWIDNLVIGGGSPWEVRVRLNASAILSKRRTENASPETKMAPILNLLHGCNHTVRIPVEDSDGDVVRCRWAESSLGECGGVCRALPGAVLNERECTLFYSATGTVSLYVVAIQIEDFHSTLDTTPFSSVPLQFVVNVHESSFDNASCYGKPTFSWPTRRDGVCVGIPFNSTFQESIIAESDGSEIQDIATQSPSGMIKSDLAMGPGANQWHVNVTWTPLLSQAGNNIFCYTASDSSGTNSDQSCITLAVGTQPPAVRNGSMFPVEELSARNSDWRLKFDRQFVRPRRSAYIRFYNDNDTEIFKIDTSTNTNVRFPTLPTDFSLAFTTTYTFKEKATYYITIDHGIAYGTEACGPESVGVFDPYYWRFTIRDDTPPVLTFLPHKMFSGGSTHIRWTFDEPATSTCLIQGPTSTFTAICSGSLSLHNLTEGEFTLFVQATNINGKSKQYQTSWFVDLQPPVVAITSKPPLITNRSSVDFIMTCSDRSPCQLWCADHAQGENDPTFVNCSSKYTAFSASDGLQVFIVYGVDEVGNIGERLTYSWTIDTVAPTVSPLQDFTVACGSPYDPSRTGIPEYSDNIDQSPSISYNDTLETGCRTARTWTVTDQAGNTANMTQVISFTNVIAPSVRGAGELFVPCGETDKLSSSDYVVKALNVTSPCGRKITVDFTNSRPITDCGITVTRQWTIMDDCNSITHFTQTIHVLFPTLPDFPANGQMHLSLTPRLGWPTYPKSQGYNVYVWRYGTSEPTTPAAFVPVWRRTYTVTDALPPNTRFLWKIYYIVPFGNGTREVPSPTWGFQTESYADLSLTSVEVPPTAFSGSSFLVTWVVENVGNVSTSQSTSYFYDAVYMSRSSEFRDENLVKQVQQQRYVDPQDGYMFNDRVRLGPSDIGTFYVFVVVDQFRHVSDFSDANNRRLSVEPLRVKLTPPPNLQVTSVSTIGLITSGNTKTVRIAVQNSGTGITQVTRWYDGVYLSLDDQLSVDDDRILRTKVHNGGLASGQRYVSTIDVTIPNAVYGDYYIIVSTDIFHQVFEHNDENDNDFPLQINIVLSGYPDLIVSNITVRKNVTTGDTLGVAAVVLNDGPGQPFEYSWRDRLTIESVTSGVKIFSATNPYTPGRTPFVQRSSYVSLFEHTVPPSVESGEYNVTIWADVSNDVFEYQYDDNNQKSTIIRINQVLPDLTLGPSTAMIIENGTGNYLTLDISILNNGPGSPQITSWENSVILSSSTKTTQLTSFLSPNTLFRNRLALNLTTHMASSFVGTFDIYASIDSRNQVLEVNENNNYIRFGHVTFQERVPDLAAKSVNCTNSAKSGSVIDVKWIVENVGNLASRRHLSWSDQITLRAESGLKTSLSHVLISLSDDLQPQQSYERQFNVTIPSNLAGQFSLGVTTALYTRRDIGVELNHGNNYMETSITISAPPSPDFKPTSCTYEIRSRFGTRLLSVVCTVTNQGNSMERPMSWTDRISLVNAGGGTVHSAYVTGVRKLSFGDTYSSIATLVLDATMHGYFQIAIQVDSSQNVTEVGGETNNYLRVSSVVFIPAGPSPRLSVVIEPLKRTVFDSGEMLSVNCSVRNTGEADLSSYTWTDSLFLFSTPDATEQQVKLSGFRISSVINNYHLRVGASYSETFVGALPYSIRGPVHVYVVTDVNNRLPIPAGLSDKAAYLNTSIEVRRGPLPDLKISLTGNSSTVRVQSGEVYKLEYTVTNIGNASASKMWYDSVYLSQEKLIDPFDIALKTAVRPLALGRGESYTQTLSFTIPFDLSAVTYYFIVTVNVRKDVFESSFDNNNDYQLTEIVVLPAVDLVVTNVTSSVSNATYLDNVDFEWYVANNGSIATFGYKCDSVYLSADSTWHISDVTVVEPRCGSFRLDQKGSDSDSFVYRATGRIPPVAKGSYKSIVRTRSNVKDYNLLNNIGVSMQNMTVRPPTISLGENKTFNFKTNQHMTFELTNIPVGIGLIVRLNTLYELAYHGLFVKRNSPPSSNDYGVAYKHTGTTQQTVYVPYTKTGDYYLLVESASAVFDQSYQVSISVREAKFEVIGVYPSIVAKAVAVTVRISGTLFGRKLRAFLTNDSDVITEATKMYRYTADEAYATFSSRQLSAGTYAVLLQDVGRNQSFELKSALTVSGLATVGKLQVNILPPRALRPGEPGIVNVKIDNAGYSDIPMPLLLLRANHSVKLLSTQSDVGVLPNQNVFFFPLSKNHPPSIILPKSTAVYSFRAIPNELDFFGDVAMSLYVAKDELVLAMLSEFKVALKPANVASDVWDIVWRNVEQCFGNNPTSLLRTINGRFTQHYAAVNPIDNIIGHVVGVSDGAVPRVVLSESVDIEDESYVSSIVLSIIRTYPQQLTVRRTTGLFGRGWTSPVLEMKVSLSANTVRLLKERQEFVFVSTDNDREFSTPSLPNDRVRINNTAVIYTSNRVSYFFDKNSGLLQRIVDVSNAEFISITYNVNNMPVMLTHHLSGNVIKVTYGSNGFISSTELLKSGDVLSQVYYSYDEDGNLVRAAGTRVTEYEYTADSDLSLIIQDQHRTAITYDAMHLMTRTVDYFGDAVLQELQIDRYCDGSIRSIVLPQNLSSLLVFGLRGELIQHSDDNRLPVNVRRDNVRDKIYITVGDESTQTHTFDRRSLTYFIANANDEKLAIKLRPDGRVISIGDEHSAYYNATYLGDLISAVSFRDGKQQKFTYNDKGHRITTTLRDGSEITYTYDDNQYLSVVQTSSGLYVYSHNSKGLLTSVSSPNDGTTKLAYNSRGLPVFVVNPDGTTLTYTYSECDRRSSLTSNTGYNSSYVYDSVCRLSKVLDGSGTVVASYEYGQHSRVAKKQLGNGMYTEYTYENGTLRLLQLRNFFPNGTLMSYYSFVYNEQGYRVETETHEGTWKYRYDAAGQLIEWRSPYSDVYENIEYGSNLNRKSKQSVDGKSFYTTNFLYQYTKYGNDENFTYSANGNLLSKSKRTVSKTKVEQFAYDELGHCTRIKAEDLACRYQYDPFGAVSSKNCSNGHYIKYLVDPFGTYGTTVLAEQTASGQRMMYYGQEHGLLAATDPADRHIGAFYIFDGDGSTTQTASQTGEILSNYAYDPFGRVLSSTMDDDNVFRFLGQYGILIVNETTNVYHIRRRLYDAEHGRFMSPDPTGVFGSPTNPYAYAINNPLTFKDTNGQIVFIPIVKIVGKIILKGAAKGGAEAALTYIYKLHLSGDKFDLKQFAKEVAIGAAKGAISSLNPFESRIGKAYYDAYTTAVTGGNILDVIESGAVNFIPKEYGLLYKVFRANLDVIASKHFNSKGFTDLLESRFMRWVRSVDPNEITGPVGYGDANYISADQSLIYKIEFENNPNATAPAQRVIIRCPIDENLDLGTFKVGLVTFDEYEHDFGLLSNQAYKQIDAIEKTGTFVYISATIDVENKEAVWQLESLDPLTGSPPTDPLVGFLPPNNGTNGQGHVTFSIGLRNSVQSLAKITENASIVFDENPHLDTSTIFHTVDKTAGTVAVNVSTLFGGVLFNMVTEDIGAGVKSVDLYLIVDGSAELIKSDINQSVVIIQLTENVLHTIIGVATDYVGNTGTLDFWSSVGVFVPAECPGNCSGRGQCGSGGVCICDTGYGGYNCSLNVKESCEPPILEVSHDSVYNDSLVVFISAKSSQPQPAASLSVKIVCEPNSTVISRGQRRDDGVYLDKTDFGNVEFTAPDWFYGLLVCKIQATVVDICGTNVRSALMSANVVAPTDKSTVNTDIASTTTAVLATSSTVGRDTASSPIVQATSLTSSFFQTPAVSGISGSMTATPMHTSQPRSHTSDRMLSDVSVSKVTVTPLSTITPVTSVTGSVTQPPVSGRTDSIGTGTTTYASAPSRGHTPDQMLSSTSDASVSKVTVTPLSTFTPVTSVTGSVTQSPGVSGRTRSIGTGTSTYVSQPRGQTSDQMLSTSDVSVSRVTATQVSGVSDRTTTASIWGPWSNWSHCSRTCDSGVQERTRQCLLSPPADCGPDDSDRRFCELSTCPGAYTLTISVIRSCMISLFCF